MEQKKLNKMKNVVLDYEDLEDEVVCPHCGVKGDGFVIRDYTCIRGREVLIECSRCDKLYKIYYEFDKVVKLEEQELNNSIEKTIKEK